MANQISEMHEQAYAKIKQLEERENSAKIILEERALMQKEREAKVESARKDREQEERARMVERLRAELQERDEIIRELRTGIINQLENEKDGKK